MEHSCHRCGATVDDGVAFCPHCNAPQIRVAGAETIAQAATMPEIASGSPTSYASPLTTIQWSQALPAAAWAGLVAAIVMAIPLGAFGLGMLGAGAVSVVLYRRRNPAAQITPAMGARLGAASGALGFGIFAIISSVKMLLFGSGGQEREQMLAYIQQSTARNSDPQVQQMLEYLKTPQGLALMMGLSLIVILVAFLAFSSAGGALAAALLRRKERP